MNTIKVMLVLCMSCLLLQESLGDDLHSRPSMRTENEMAVQVRQFVASLASQDCETRSRAIFEQLPRLKTIPRQIFMNESASATQKVKSKVADLLKALEREEKAGKEFEALVKTWIAPALKAEGVERSRRFALAKENLLAIGKSEAEPMFRREAAVGTMEFFVDQYDDPDGEARRLGLLLVEWRNALTALLMSEDAKLRLLAGGMMGQSLRSGDIDGNNIVPILLASLRDDDLSARVLAQKALMHMNSQKVCIDPTDSLDKREIGIQEWETWWNQIRKN